MGEDDNNYRNTPPKRGYKIIPVVQLVVSIGGRLFKIEADTLPEATAKLTEQMNAAIAENDAACDRMEDFLVGEFLAAR